MFGALGINRNGLHANQYKLDSISDEIANVNTDGYKKSQVSFQELLISGDTSVGAKAGINKIDFKQGILKDTGFKWDLAVEGDGFFAVRSQDGQEFLKRDGSFQMTEGGIITDRMGNYLVAEYSDDIADYNHKEINISKEGILTIDTGEETIELGKVPLFMPENIQHMDRVGENLYLPAEGDVITSSMENPEEFGDIAQGYLEGSNSDLAMAMSEMLTTQRAYSLNAQAIRSTDEIMRVINEIKR